jgi:hypothetical protein
VSQTEALEWSAMLRSCSAWDAYKRSTARRCIPRLVAEFLAVQRGFPALGAFLRGELNRALRRISGVAEGHFCNDAEKLAGRLLAELQFSTVDEIFDRGLHLIWTSCRPSSTTSARRFSTPTFSSRFKILEDEHMVQQEEQQQQVPNAHPRNPSMKRIGILTAGGDTPASTPPFTARSRAPTSSRSKSSASSRASTACSTRACRTCISTRCFQEIPELDPTKGGTLIGSSRDFVDPNKKESSTWSNRG